MQAVQQVFDRPGEARRRDGASWEDRLAGHVVEFRDQGFSMMRSGVRSAEAPL